MQVKDYTVSGEVFPLASCQSCSLRFTQDVPGAFEIAPYYKSDAYISHTETRKGIINRLYHLVRNRTLIRKRKLIEKWTQRNSGKLLDIGSGTGAFPGEMTKHGWETVGLEPDEEARSMARRVHHIELLGIQKLFSMAPESFDAITLWHVLEHVHDLKAYFSQIGKLIRPGGRVFIAVPNFTSYDAGVYGHFWAAYDVPRHLYHFSPSAMEMLVKENDLRLLKCLPMWYDSFYVSLLSSRYRHGKTKWIEALWTGLVSNLSAIKDPRKCSSVIYVIGR